METLDLKAIPLQRCLWVRQRRWVLKGLDVGSDLVAGILFRLDLALSRRSSLPRAGEGGRKRLSDQQLQSLSDGLLFDYSWKLENPPPHEKAERSSSDRLQQELSIDSSRLNAAQRARVPCLGRQGM